MPIAGKSSDQTRLSRSSASYAMYGVHVASSIPLPIAADPEWSATPDIVVRRVAPGIAPPRPDGELTADVYCHAPCHRGEIVRRIDHGADGSWIWNRSVGTCHVSPDGHTVDVYPEADTDEHLLGLVLAGQISILALHKQGSPVLHASGVVTGSGVVAFTGPSGRGKSTMVASFLRRGAALLTDDALPVYVRGDQVVAAPSLPFMKLWPETAECALALPDTLPPVEKNSPKKMFALDTRFPFARGPAPLKVIYVLSRYDPAVENTSTCDAQTLPTREAMLVLLEQTSFGSYLSPSDAAKLLPRYAALLARAPVRRLRYPTGFEYQEAVHAWILADMAQLELAA